MFVVTVLMAVAALVVVVVRLEVVGVVATVLVRVVVPTRDCSNVCWSSGTRAKEETKQSTPDEAARVPAVLRQQQQK